MATNRQWQEWGEQEQKLAMDRREGFTSVMRPTHKRDYRGRIVYKDVPMEAMERRSARLFERLVRGDSYGCTTSRVK